MQDVPPKCPLSAALDELEGRATARQSRARPWRRGNGQGDESPRRKVEGPTGNKTTPRAPRECALVTTGDEFEFGHLKRKDIVDHIRPRPQSARS